MTRFVFGDLNVKLADTSVLNIMELRQQIEMGIQLKISILNTDGSFSEYEVVEPSVGELKAYDLHTEEELDEEDLIYFE